MKNMNKFIKEHGLVVIFRGVDISKAVSVAKAVYDGGARVVEVAFNPSDADTVSKTTELIKTINEAMEGKLLVGAGTVISKEYVTAAYNAGAKFIFSPNVDTEVIRLTKQLGLVSIPGAFTPSEVMTAYNAGADIIKMFPITVNDVDYVKGITRPLSHIPFICVGGTDLDTIEAFIKSGAQCVGTGISILKPELIENEDYAAISELTRLHLEKIAAARKDKESL